MSGQVAAIVALSRPLFLAGGAVFFLLGSALAWGDGAPIDGFAFAVGQFAVTAGQLVTHFSNEYFDVASDRLNGARTWWSGGSGVLAAGRLSPSIALWAAGAATLAFAGAWLLLARGGASAPALGLLLLGFALSWSYSAPPLQLHSSGFGELAGALVLTGIVPVAGYVLQRGPWPPNALWAIVPLLPLQYAMLLVVSLPDVPADRAAGKRTFAVRYGRRAAARLAIGAIGLGFALAFPVAVLADMPLLMWIGWAPLGGLLVWLLRDDFDARPAEWRITGFLSIAVVMGPAVVTILWLYPRLF